MCYNTRHTAPSLEFVKLGRSLWEWQGTLERMWPCATAARGTDLVMCWWLQPSQSTVPWGGQRNRTEGCLGTVDVPGNQTSYLQQGCFSHKEGTYLSPWYSPVLSECWAVTRSCYLLPVLCSQVATAEASQESSYAINWHNEGPEQHDSLRVEGRAMAIHPGLINELPDVLEKKTRFAWIMGLDNQIPSHLVVLQVRPVALILDLLWDFFSKTS